MRKATYTYTDDAAQAVKVETDDSKTAGNVTESQYARITLTQGETVYIVDTAQSNPIAAYCRKVGTKQAKRGRKASA